MAKPVTTMLSSREMRMATMRGLALGELSLVRDRLVDFAEEMLSSLARKDQRRWGEVYLRGLMLDGRRKSIEPMAARLEDGDEQCLQQFVNQSPWRWEPVRERLAVRLCEAIEPAAPRTSRGLARSSWWRTTSGRSRPS